MIGAIGELAVSNTLLSLVLAGLAWVIHRHGRYPAIAHVLWVLVLLKVITPPMVVMPVPLGELATVATAPAVGQATAADAASLAAANPSVATFIGQYGVPLMLITWLAGSVTVLTVSVRRIRRFGRLLGMTALPAPPGLTVLAASVAGELGVRRVPTIALTSANISPMTWWKRGRVRVVLPAALLGRVDETELRWVLAHELAHVRRRDHLVRWLEWIACVAFWWNPVVWWARHELRLDEEDACDALVLERVAGAPRAYASTLLDVLEVLAGPAHEVPAVATGIDAARSLEHRLSNIVSSKSRRSAPQPLVATVSAAAFGIMAIGVGAPAGDATQDLAGQEADVGVEVSDRSTPILSDGSVVERYATVSTSWPVGMTLAPDSYVGTVGADTYTGTAAHEDIRGRAGPDLLRGGAGRDVIDGGAGSDVVFGGAGRDRLRGGSGDDVIRGGAGRDRISAGRGDDVVRTWSDGTPDRIDCGAGDDRAVVDRFDTTERCEQVVIRDRS